MTSLVCIVPAAQQEAANSLAVALGHDVAPGNTYSVPLSPTGQAPATHYGCHANVTPGFALMVQIGATGEVPPEGASAELIAQALALRAQWESVMISLIWSAQPDSQSTALEHFTTLAASHGLQATSLGT